MAVLMSRLNGSFCKGLNSFLSLSRSAQSGDALLEGSLRLYARLSQSTKTELRCYDLIDLRDRTLKIKYHKPSKQPQSRTN